jgi:ATP-binding protein involved in chromosome partitioning
VSWLIAQSSYLATLLLFFNDTAMTETEVRQHLALWLDPITESHSLSDPASIRSLALVDGKLAVELRLPYPAKRSAPRLTQHIEHYLCSLPGVQSAVVELGWAVHAHKVQGELTPLPNIKNVIAVASGKGGVGKSTTAANVALALAYEGAAVGVLDADIYGPSQVLMLGIEAKAESRDGGYTLTPKSNYGLEMMSIGLMAGDDTPMVLRGPMVTKALMEMLSQTNWGSVLQRELDYLIIDLPPGTGDIQLTLAQRVPLSGALIVTTPQDLALLDAKKAIKMFEKVAVPVLGIVENMATHVCTNCGHEEAIFGSGGGAKLAQDYHVDLLGQLPLDIRIRERADGGQPTVASDPEGELAQRYRSIAAKLASKLADQARSKAISFPKIVIQNT